MTAKNAIWAATLFFLLGFFSLGILKYISKTGSHVSDADLAASYAGANAQRVAALVSLSAAQERFLRCEHDHQDKCVWRATVNALQACREAYQKNCEVLVADRFTKYQLCKKNGEQNCEAIPLPGVTQ